MKTEKKIKNEKKIKSDWMVSENYKRKGESSYTCIVYRLWDVLKADEEENREIAWYIKDKEIAIDCADVLNRWKVINEYIKNQP